MYLASMDREYYSVLGGELSKNATRHELDRNKKYLSVIPAEDALPLRKSCCQKMPLQLTGMHIMIVAFCLYKYFPFGGLQRDLCVLPQQLPHGATMFGYIHIMGRRLPGCI